MANEMDDWPFDEPRNRAAITVRQIVREGNPVLRVSHDRDGNWQFLEWETPNVADAMVVSLSEMVAKDSSLIDLADLPLGWRAIRQHPTMPWTREPNPHDTD